MLTCMAEMAMRDVLEILPSPFKSIGLRGFLIRSRRFTLIMLVMPFHEPEVVHARAAEELQKQNPGENSDSVAELHLFLLLL